MTTDDPAETPNYYEIRQKSREEEVGEPWQEELGVYDNVQLILSVSTLLPDVDIQRPILSSFLLLPHMVLDLAPVGWGIGESGSGKSQVVALIKFLYQVPIPFGTSTAVGLRNVIVKHRFVNYDPTEPEKDWRERHFILCIDNATSDFLKADKNMQGLLLQGINRTTDKWLISGEKSGTVLEFHTFCRKYISSCFPINDREVQRRCLLFQFEKSEDEIVADLIDLTTCNFDWSQYLKDYWTIDRLNEFKDLGRAYPKKQFKGDKNRIYYYRDIHSILLMNGVENPIELINEFENREIMSAQDTGLYQQYGSVT